MSGSRDIYDVVITGGGLAGLSLSIQLAKCGYSVVLIEKNSYPFHRVCGEYISRESDGFLHSIGIDLEEMGAVPVSTLEFTTGNGRAVKQLLPLGGHGISRYLLDQELAVRCRAAGVLLLENTRVRNVEQQGDLFRTETDHGDFFSKLAAGSFGKRSNLDISWKRPFIAKTRDPLNNYIGVKYHVRGDFPADTISLHLFRKGYAGLVKIERGLYNFCYLSAGSNLKDAGNSIEKMEQEILCLNPAIRDLFGRISKMDPHPVTVSQVSFESKSVIENGLLMTGDAAGMITPLCGNGMSMALHSSKIAAGLMDSFLGGRSSYEAMLSAYSSQWNKEFASRMRTGRILQSALSVPVLSSAMLGMGVLFPALLSQLIQKTHGRPF